MERVTNPHDKYFRASMSDLRIAKSFLKMHLPENVLTMMDWESLQIASNNHIDQHLSESMTDILYRAKLNKTTGYISILVEHQSTVDPLMAFRVLCYSINIMRQYIRQHPQEKLPLVIPLVFYSGRKRYTGSTDVFELFGDLEPLARETFLQPFQLIDLSRIPDQALAKSTWASVMQLVQKRIWERDFLPIFEALAPLLRELAQQDGHEYVYTTLKYICNSAELEDLTAFVRIINTEISSEIGENVMSLAKILHEKGFHKGIRKGELQGIRKGEWLVAKRMLQDGADTEFVSKMTGLTAQELDQVEEIL